MKKAKTTAKNLATKNHRKVQSKRTQQSDGVITIAGNKQKLWKAARKKLWAHQKLQNYQNTKLQNNVYYFNQHVEPAYSTDDVSQNSLFNIGNNSQHLLSIYASERTQFILATYLKATIGCI